VDLTFTHYNSLVDLPAASTRKKGQERMKHMRIIFYLRFFWCRHIPSFMHTKKRSPRKDLQKRKRAKNSASKTKKRGAKAKGPENPGLAMPCKDNRDDKQ
jgi:hypothetical protein